MEFPFLGQVTQAKYDAMRAERDAAIARAEAAEARVHELESWLTELGYEWDGTNWIPVEGK